MSEARDAAGRNRRDVRMRASPATSRRVALWTALSLTMSLVGCAGVGRLQFVPETLAPADTTGGHHPELAVRHTASPAVKALHPIMGSDTLIGFVPGTGDSSKRYLGRLRDGYTIDTLNVILLGDNRPGYRTSRLDPQFAIIRKGLSLNPVRFGKALINIPVLLWKGLFPDLALIRETPAFFQHMPKWGREHQVLTAVLAKLDTMQARGQIAACVINTGDLVYDGQRPAHWQRFLRINEPLYTRVPYLAVAGNHEKTWTSQGVENWRVAAGLPVAGDRLYYCFDSADGWVRFLALDTNPITMPGVHWSKEVQVKYSKEQVDWLTARIKEHEGPTFVVMHSPPFSAGYHRMDWDMDPIMRERRDQIIRAMHEGGIGVLATGHEHDYERALLTWPDGSVLIAIVQGGAGAPLHPLPPPAEAAHLFSMYQSAGSTIKPENVFTAVANNFTVLRLWFGGGELQTFAVDKASHAKLIDHVAIDLKRFGRPKIIQRKVQVAPTARVQPSNMEVKQEHGIMGPADTTAASRRIETQPAPGHAHKRRARHG